MIPLFKVYMSPTAWPALSSVLHSGYIGQGKKVVEFEAELSFWTGGSRPVTTNSCTSALTLALHLAEVCAGDLVASSPMTCLATNSPILDRQADIAWVDIDPGTGNMDPEDLRRVFNAHPQIRAVIAVHWGGYPCDLDGLRSVCRERGVPLIEDAAHAFGAFYGKRMIGFDSDFACFSFQAIKHVTTGDGGALTCANPQDQRRARLLRWYGLDRDAGQDMRCLQDIDEIGFKFHMNDLAATIGLENLKSAAWIMARHHQNAGFYNMRFASLRHVGLPRYSPEHLSSYWLYAIFVPDVEGAIRFLESRGIAASRVHRRNDTYPCLSRFARRLPGVDEFSARQVNIPVGWWLSYADREAVAQAVEELDKSL